MFTYQRRSGRFLVLLIVVVPLLVCASTGWGQADKLQAEYDVLVKELGSPSFRARKQAHEKLVQIGIAIKPALLRAMRTPDLEIRMSAHRVLVQILQADFDAKLAAFLADTDGSHDHDLPCWNRFEKQLGNSPASRRLFADMVRSEAPLLSAIADENGSEPLQPILTRRIQQLYDVRQFSGTRQPVSLPSLATVLFASTQPGMTRNTSTDSRVYSMLSQPTIKQAVLFGEQADQLKQLVVTWIVSQSDSTQAYYGIRLALSYGLQDACIKLGRSLLAATNTPSHIIPYAAAALARFGSPDDAKYLISHLDDTTVCHTWSNRQIKKTPIRIQIRDVMLALLIHMSGQEPKEYGYKLLSKNPETVYSIHTYGFVEDKDRDEALAKWKKWQAEHKADPTPTATKADSKSTSSKDS